MPRVLVTGSNGQLGSELKDISTAFPDYDFTFTDVEELDIGNESEIADILSEKTPDFLINCAAFTAVDKAEEDYDKAYSLNAKAVAYLARACKKNHVHLLHISTDFVFDGEKNIPYKEDDLPNPASAYGKTKLHGEQEVVTRAGKFTIVRTSWLYSHYGHNFVKSMIKYGKERGKLNVVFDQVGTPTYAHDLATALMKLIEKKSEGIFHFSNEGVASWYDFAKAAIDLAAIDAEISPIHTSEYPLPATRPAFSVMDKTKIRKELGMKIPYWRDSLEKCIEKLNIR